MAKVAIVTGSNKGIGLSIVKLLLQRGFDGDVYLTARDDRRGQLAVEKLNTEFGLYPKYHQLDITDKSSIERLRDFLLMTYGGLDVLVNNAAIITHPEKPKVDQVRETLETNYYALITVCDIMFPILRPGARVVHLSSSAGRLQVVRDERLRARFLDPALTVEKITEIMKEFEADVENDVQSEHDFGMTKHGFMVQCYSVSKVGVAALGIVHQKMFDKDERADMIVNSVHPGYVVTDMTRNTGNLQPDQGAEAPVYLAMLPPDDPQNPKGQYVWCDSKVVNWNSTKLQDEV